MHLDYRLIQDQMAPIGHLPLRQQRKVCELRTAFSLAQARSVGDKVADPDAIAARVAPLLKGAVLESLVLCLMGSSMTLVTEPFILHRGTQDGCDVDPRAVLRAALAHPTCSHVAMAHNHPTGTVEPSAADCACTQRVAAACRAVGLVLLDHVVIVSETAYTSLRRERCALFS